MQMIYYLPGDKSLNIFSSKINYSKPEISFFDEQMSIFVYYVEWLFNAVKLEFGLASSSPYVTILDSVLDSLFVSATAIFLSLIVSIIISACLYQCRRNRWFIHVKDILLSFSLLHIIYFFFLFKSILSFNLTQNIIGVIFLLTMGNSFIIDFYSIFESEVKKILNKDYAKFGDFCGYNKIIFIKKELVISIISLSASKVPILFSGFIIIEIISSGRQDGIGYLIYNSGFANEVPNYQMFYSGLVFSVLFSSFFFFISDYIEETFLN